MTEKTIGDKSITQTRKQLEEIVKRMNKDIAESHKEDKYGFEETDRNLMRKTRDNIIRAINEINTLELQGIIKS